METVTPRRKFLPEIQALRALAVLLAIAVVLAATLALLPMRQWERIGGQALRDLNHVSGTYMQTLAAPLEAALLQAMGK